MAELIEFHGWRFEAEVERTRAAYQASESRGAEGCSCAYCRNLVAQRALEYPAELRAFLESVGVDPFKEAEVWEAGPLEDGCSYNEGWWHFIGRVEAAGEIPIDLASQPAGRAKQWRLRFEPDKGDLKIATLPGSPLVRVKISAMLPWVLDEAYPG